MSPQGGTMLESAVADSLIDAARAAAEQAAARAGVRIAMPLELDQLAEAAEVWHRIWSPDGEPPVSSEMLRAMTHVGNYLSAAYLDGRVVGALLGFYGGNGRVDRVHSHILGVEAQANGRGVGNALKLHQRAWALQRGITRISWTYDPLVRRNGYFNLVKLGARGVEYLVDFYGTMPDAINGSDHSDRILVDWDLTAELERGSAHGGEVSEWLDRGAVVALDVDDRGAPVLRDAAGAAILLCATPPDIVEMRTRDAAAAREWRLAVRAVLSQALERGLRLVSMARGGWYVLAAVD